MCDEQDHQVDRRRGGRAERGHRVCRAAAGGGTVTQTEVGDEESYYEVEVTFADGHQVDVQLDENFDLVTTIPDGGGG